MSTNRIPSCKKIVLTSYGNSESLGVEISFGSRAKLRAENDGGVVLRTTGSYSGSSRIDSVPIISFKVSTGNLFTVVHTTL